MRQPQRQLRKNNPFMRKYLLFLAFSLICCSNSWGQLLRRDFLQEVSFGLNGGANFSKVSFLHNVNDRLYELGDQSFEPGYRFGFVARYIHRSHFGLQLEVNYEQAGWKEDFHEDAGVSMVNGVDLQNVKFGRTLEYLNVPVLAHIYFGKRRVRFIVNLGPELRFLMKYKEMKWNIPSSDDRKNAFQIDDPRFKEVHNDVDYGLCGGGGFDVRIGNRFNLLAEFRYSYGFGDLYSNKKSDLFQRSNNQMFGVVVTALVPAIQFKERDRLKKE